MKKKIKITALCSALALSAMLASGCRQSDRVSYNISKEADSFNVTRKITVINVLTNSILMELTGTFSIANNSANELEIICMTNPSEYKKHFVYLNDWTVYTIEDVSGADVDPYKYEWIFNPSMLIPVEIEMQ